MASFMLSPDLLDWTYSDEDGKLHLRNDVPDGMKEQLEKELQEFEKNMSDSRESMIKIN